MTTYKWVAVVLFTVTVFGARAEDETFAALLDRLLPGMGAAEIPARSQAQQELQQAVWRLGAPGMEEDLREACKLMAAKLGKETSKPGQLWLLTQLMREGDAECVAPVSALLRDSDAEIRDSARRALMNNPNAVANTALVGALGSAGTASEREALCLALGYRADPTSVAVLSEQLKGGRSVAIAAARALGKIATGDAARVLGGALPSASGELRRRIGDACLACADKMASGGKVSDAAAIYAKLNDAAEPQPVRLAALQGQISLAGKKAVPMIIEFLKGKDAFARNVAAGAIQDLPAGSDLTALAAALPDLPEVGQELVLHAFAACRAPVTRPAVERAAREGAEAVRKAAIQCLATLGDASAVPLLIDALLAGDAYHADAKRSMAALHGEGVDEALIERMLAEEDPGRKAVLIAVLQDRRTPKAVDVLLETLGSDDKRLHGVAMRALGSIARSEHVSALIRAMLKTDGRERKDAQKAIVEVCARCAEGDRTAVPVLDAFRKADPAGRVGILPVLGSLGGKDAFKVVEASLRSPELEERDAAVEAVCRWPDDDALPVLESLAAGAGEARNMAIRAYVRLTIDGKRKHGEALKMLQQAMDWSDAITERKLVLNRAIQVRRVDALRFVMPYLDEPELVAEAGRTVVYLAGRREIRQSHGGEVKQALEKVLAVAKDSWLKKEAARLRQGL